jgi:protein gp37
LSQAITTSAKRLLPPANWGSIRKLALWSQAILASAKSLLPPATWDRARDRVVGWVKDRELTWAKSSLEQQLARIIETANGHRAQGLPSGSPAYVALSQQANLKIDAFCAKHSVERLAVEQEVPVLRDLDALTRAPSLAVRLTKCLAILIAGIIGAIAVGCAGGLVAAGYNWVVRLLIR